jgi:hypothetical protein
MFGCYWPVRVFLAAALHRSGAIVLQSDKEPRPAVLSDEAARELIEVSRLIEVMASRAAEQLEATFFAYAKELRRRAQAQLGAEPRVSGDFIED